MSEHSESFLFPKWRHLRSSQDFARIYELKLRAGDDFLLLFGAPNELGHTRIGLSVSKRHGNSVQRHRLRRLIREGYRLAQHDVVEGWDLICIPRADSGATTDDFRRSFIKLSGKLVRRLDNTTP